MVALSFFAKSKVLAAAAAAFSALVSANPALANSAAAAADIAAPLRAAQAAKSGALGSSDEEFRNLFASWKSLDGSSARTPLVATTSASVRIPGKVSIPSLMPVDGVRLTSDYGMRYHPVLGGRRAHKGIDLAGPTGTPVRATADGMVSRADWYSSYGLYISLEHGGEIQTRYGHLSRVSVAAGQTVHKGDVIGYVGSTGRSTGPHLHYEVRIAGMAVNPTPYMQGTLLSDAASNHDADKTGKGGPE